MSISMFKESVRMSLSNIRANKMRSFLTILGVLIGVTAVIALITTMEGVTGEITSQFESLGTGRVMVSMSGTPLKSGLSADDLLDVAAVENVSGVSPTVTLTLTASTESGAWDDEASVEGKNELYFQRNPDLLGRGRAINRLDVDNRAAVCVIDVKMQEKLFFGEDPIGKRVYIGGVEHRVVGVLSDADDMDVMSQAMGGSDDGKLIVPYTDAMKLGGQAYVRQADVYIDDVDLTDETIDKLEQVVNAAFNYKEDSYSVINMQSLLSTMDSIMSLMTGLLAGIASISLLVGGIGIMNMMLVSVTERTTEIGLRKALGAKPVQIQVQFLIEAFVLSLVGGVLGMILGNLLSLLLATLMGTRYAISPWAIALGVGFSALVGLIFGWTPARRASILNPIDALRSV